MAHFNYNGIIPGVERIP